jgi:hypothetical protein
MTTSVPEKDLRTQQIEARKALIKKLTPGVARVRVSPASDELRRVLKHPTGLKFPATGSVEWPLDQFTRRRIKDGTVTREEREENERRASRRSASSSHGDPSAAAT